MGVEGQKRKRNGEGTSDGRDSSLSSQRRWREEEGRRERGRWGKEQNLDCILIYFGDSGSKIETLCVCVCTCGRTCGVLPLSPGVVSLYAFPLSLGSFFHDGAPGKHALGTHGSETAPRRYGNIKEEKGASNGVYDMFASAPNQHDKWSACHATRFAWKSATFRKFLSAAELVTMRRPSPGVAHSWGAVLPLPLPFVCPLSRPLSVLVPLVVSTGIVIPGFRVVHHRWPRRRHTSGHRWRVCTWRRKEAGSWLGCINVLKPHLICC